SLIAGNALVAPLSRLVRSRTGLLMLSVVVQAAMATACGMVGRGVGSPDRFYVVVALYLVYGLAVGVAMPVKQAYLNAHITSAQRATIISLDSMFANVSEVLGHAVRWWLGMGS